MNRPRVIVVAKHSAYREHVENRQDQQTLNLLESRHPAVSKMKHAHEEHERTLEVVLAALEKEGIQTTVLGVPHEPFSTKNVMMVITVGGDGTLLAASHHCGTDTPILGVNSAPSSSVGFFCAFRQGPRLGSSIRRALRGPMPKVSLARMQVRIGRRVVSRRVLNDVLFCHPSPAATSRYLVDYRKTLVEHKSSGFWLGPAAGSTAAQLSAGGKVLPLASKKLQFVAREPYRLNGRPKMSRVLVRDGETLVIVSKMHEALLFLDGPHASISLGLGDKLRFSLSPEPLRLLGLSRRRGRPSH